MKTMRVVAIFGLALLAALAFSAAPVLAQEDHKAECEKWCKAHPDKCVKCSPVIGCGPGLKKIKSFRGKGKNWYACAKITDKNEAACWKWCKENPDKCKKCSPTIGCGKGYKKIKTFGGKGKNFYACARIKNPNREACLKWCKANPDKCAKCSSKVGCGAGYTKIKSFKGKGKNWYACKKR